jgi:tetratricopeptide (TPR) repeat protein
MKFILLTVCFFFISLSAEAQVGRTQALAKQYYQTGDYEKSAQMYEELFQEDPNNNSYYTFLYNSYLRLNDYDNAEKMVKKLIKKNKDELNYQVDLGYIYSQNNQAKAAEEQFNNVLEQLIAEQNSIRNIANKFISIRQNDFAIASYLKGRILLKNKSMFGFELGNVYLQENKAKEAVATYLQLLDDNPSYKSSIQNVLANNIDKDNIEKELESQLYALVQKNSNKNEYPELLVWLFTHQEDYEQALIQAKALDKRNQEDGARIFMLANDALVEGQYDAAIDAYKYIQSKGGKGKYFQVAKSSQINAQKLKLTHGQDYTAEDINVLKTEYLAYLDNYGKSILTVSSIQELASLEAYFIHNMEKAISLLEEAINLPNLPRKTKNEIKLDLGDFYILYGDVWEATLYYAQVDKEEKDSPLGEDARYRNARLSYYKGEFEWSQAQLGILKGATTELIANNALELSVFILDNLGLDTTTATMQMFADAELLYLQNKDEDAVTKLDSILYLYPGHALSDDVIYKKANIAFENRKYEESVQLLNTLLQNHSDDILADNATFMLGDIYENKFKDAEKAMIYYKTIITEFSGSILLVEARKRFRNLRGDGV